MNNASAHPSKSLFGAGLFTALAASLCCITPLLAVVGGIGSTASSFAWVEPYRPYLVGLTVAVLGFAWYQQLKPAPVAADCCAVPAKRSFMQSKAFLVVITVMATVLLALPYYEAKLLPTVSPNIPTVATGTNPVWQTRTYRISGMTCEACTHHVKSVVQQVPGVQGVTVSYEQATAQVRFDAAHTPAAKVEAAINSTGYQVLSSNIVH